MKDIDPFGYSHVCDHAASYHPRPKSKFDLFQNQWTAVSDMTGRGYKQSGSRKPYGYTFANVRPGSARKISPHKPISGFTLDVENRFFDDNKNIYQTYGPVRDQKKPPVSNMKPVLNKPRPYTAGKPKAQPLQKHGKHPSD